MTLGIDDKMIKLLADVDELKKWMKPRNVRRSVMRLDPTGTAKSVSE
jgi:hypothetical protein